MSDSEPTSGNTPEPAPASATPSFRAARPKGSPFTRVILIIVGVAAIAGGIMQITRGARQMKGNPEVERLASESESAFNTANKDLTEAAKLMQGVQEAVDKDGLLSTRREKRTDVEKAISLFTGGIDNLRVAAARFDEAAGKKPGEKMENFFKAAAEAYRGLAAANDINREVARMVIDDSIASREQLGVKVAEANERFKKLLETANVSMGRARLLHSEAQK